MQTSTSTCSYCGNEFQRTKHWSKSDSVFCSRSCAGKHIATTKLNNVWTEAELALLKSWVGKKPLAQIQREWKQVAKKRGWEDRSDDAIHVKFTRLCRELGVSEKPKADNLPMRELARQLDVPSDRVRAWRRKGLPAKIYSLDAHLNPRIIAIARKDLRSFAAQNPELFWGIDSKYLSKVLGDSKLAHAIAQTVEQPKSGRAITVIRLDTGDVYRSARATAVALALEKNTIERCARRETPLQNGMDFAKIDYPVYWIPLVYREEFNLLAGKIFYEIYIQVRSLDGYSKASCVIVAGRMAVQIALFCFKRNFKETKKGIELTPKELLANFWTTRILADLKTFLLLNKSESWHKIASKVRSISYKAFIHFFPNSSYRQLQTYLEDYAADYIQRLTQRYFASSYLPRDYRPTNKLEHADLFTYIYGSIFASVEIRSDFVMLLCCVMAWSWMIRQGLLRERSCDLSGTGFDEDSIDRGLQYHATQSLNKRQSNEGHAAELLNNLIAYIEQLPIEPRERDLIKMYIDLKLEECNDREIASVMKCSTQDVLRIENRLKELALAFRGLGELQPQLPQDRHS